MVKTHGFPVDFPLNQSIEAPEDRVASLNAELQGRSPQEILQWAAWPTAWLGNHLKIPGNHGNYPLVI